MNLRPCKTYNATPLTFIKDEDIGTFYRLYDDHVDFDDHSGSIKDYPSQPSNDDYENVYIIESDSDEYDEYDESDDIDRLAENMNIIIGGCISSNLVRRFKYIYTIDLNIKTKLTLSEIILAIDSVLKKENEPTPSISVSDHMIVVKCVRCPFTFNISEDSCTVPELSEEYIIPNDLEKLCEAFRRSF